MSGVLVSIIMGIHTLGTADAWLSTYKWSHISGMHTYLGTTRMK